MLSEHIITRIEHGVFVGVRPRVVGRNAIRGVHGQTVDQRIVRLQTNKGATGWAWPRASVEDAQRLLGKRLSDIFDPNIGTCDEFLAFDFPLWDLAGQILNQPVYEMLGGDGIHPVPVYDGSIYIDEVDPDTGRDDGLQPMLDAVTEGSERGFRAFKVKIGRGHKWMERDAGMKRDIEVIRAIREQIGSSCLLMIDGNNGFTPDTARELMLSVGDCDIYWFEEPFPESIEETVPFHDFLREQGWQTRLADGEGAESRSDELAEVIRAGGIDVVQLDLRFYTLTRWLKYLPLVYAMNAVPAPHNWGSHLSGFYIPQFARGVPNVAPCETDVMTVGGVDSAGYILDEGVLTIPDAPGFGLGLDDGLFSKAVAAENGWVVSL